MRSITPRSLSAADQAIARQYPDLTRLDIEDAIRRFANKNPSAGQSSLQTYAARLRSAIRSFLEWKGVPIPEAVQRTRIDEQRPLTRPTAPKSGLFLQAPGTLTHQFPLREECTVVLSNIPKDLKRAEAERIALFLRSLSVDSVASDPSA